MHRQWICRLLALGFLFAFSACQTAPVAPKSQSIAFASSLWQAARETVSFLPEGTADPVTGTLTTGWGAAQPHARERYKIDIALTYGQSYDAAVHVVVHHQIKSGEGWIETADDDAAALKFTTLIIHEARELREAKKSA